MRCVALVAGFRKAWIRPRPGAVPGWRCAGRTAPGSPPPRRSRVGTVWRSGRRLRPLPSEEALRIGGDEDHRHLELVKQFIDCVEARTAVGELDIGEDQSWLLRLGYGDGLRMRTGDADHAMAEALGQALEIERDEGLVLDDEDIGRDL